MPDAERRAAAAPRAGRLSPAQRLSAWTSRLVVSGMVLVVGLAFARQVLRWWGEDDRPADGRVAAAAPDLLGDPAQGHMLRFGDRAWTVHRQGVTGPRAAAAAALQAQCRRLTVAGAMPPGAADASETELLVRLSALQPAESAPDEWRVHVVAEGCPMAVGLRRAAAADAGTGVGTKSAANLAESGYRVVTWGVATPTDKESWALYAFQPDAARAAPSDGLPEPPYPPGCRGLLSVRVAGGGLLAAFAGDVAAERCERFYDEWFGQQGFAAAAPWQSHGNGRYARFVEGGAPGGAAIEVYLNVDAQKRLSGVVMGTMGSARGLPVTDEGRR